MDTRDTVLASASLTLPGSSHYTPINFFADYGVVGNKLTITSTVATSLLIRTSRRQSASLETGLAIVERYPEDLTAPADVAVANTAVIALSAYSTRSLLLAELFDTVHIAAENACVLTVTLSESTVIGRPRPTDGGAWPTLRPSFTHINRLTRHYATGAQVIIDPGFWTDDKTTPTYFRTNQVAQGMICKINGYKSIAIAVSRRLYGRASFLPPIIACRKARTEEELWGSDTNWTYGIHTTTNGATTLFSDLDAGDWYVQWAITHPASDENCTAACDSHEQADAPWSDANSTEPFLGMDFIGYETTGNGSFKTITWSRPTKNFGVYTDSNGEGRTTGDGSAPTVTIYEPRFALYPSYVVSQAPWDIRGALAQWEYLIIQRWCRANGYIPRILNRSFGGFWQAKMSAALRAGLGALWPGLYLDLINVFKYRTNRSNTDYTINADWTGNGSVGFIPAAAIIGSFYNDLLMAQYNGDTDLKGVTFKNNVALNTGPSLLNSFYTAFPSVALFVVGPQPADNVFPGIDTLTQLRAACASDVSWYNITSPGGVKYDANKGRFASIYDYRGTTGIVTDGSQLHPTAAQHDLIEQALRTKFAELSF